MWLLVNHYSNSCSVMMQPSFRVPPGIHSTKLCGMSCSVKIQMRAALIFDLLLLGEGGKCSFLFCYLSWCRVWLENGALLKRSVPINLLPVIQSWVMWFIEWWALSTPRNRSHLHLWFLHFLSRDVFWGSSVVGKPPVSICWKKVGLVVLWKG